METTLGFSKVKKEEKKDDPSTSTSVPLALATGSHVWKSQLKPFEVFNEVKVIYLDPFKQIWFIQV